MTTGADADHHQLVTHYDPTRLEWCGAECTCGQWSYEADVRIDRGSHALPATAQAEKEWRRHLPARERI